MTIATITTQFDNEPDAALDAILVHDGPILVDLDETLYLRNSTEDFIDCARPGLLALLLMRTLDVIKPWRWTGGAATRDVWRVRLVMLSFPWVKSRWQHRVTELAREFGNARLIAALKKRAVQPTIVTAGFQPVVTPLIAALGFMDATTIAARLTHTADRRHGKLQMAIETLGKATVQNALLVTDSADDLPLLEACARPFRVLWPDSHCRMAFAHTYLPGLYLSEVKRPGAQFISRIILLEDFPLWVLTSVALAAKPALHVAGLLFLLASFWVVYERGYVDNDLMAARFEEAPQLSPEYWKAPVATPLIRPWIWAVSFGLVAIFLLRWPAFPGAKDMVKWVTVLFGTHLWFKLYNRYDKSARVWMFPALQFTRSAAFLALVPMLEIGVAAIGAHVLMRWLPYYVYRLSGKPWIEGPAKLVRLVFFLILALLLAITLEPTTVFNWTGFTLLAWYVYRARKDVRRLLTSAKRLDRHRSVPDEDQHLYRGTPRQQHIQP
jgi:hypothetical protein